MRNRRSSLEIIINILWAISKGIKKPTNIMYNTRVSWNALKEMLELMTDQGFIKKMENPYGYDKRTNTIYETTQKGENIIKYFNRASELIDHTFLDLVFLKSK